VEAKLEEYCKLEKCYEEIEALQSLTINEYFSIFNIISKLVLTKTKDGKRLCALLQNLEERRENKWKKHNVESAPTKLKDIPKEDEEPTNEQKIKE
jgi:hypothetical protein